MSRFVLTDISDYIAPSQACTVASFGEKPPPAGVQLQKRVKKSTRADNGAAPKEADSVKISLHDCLACSGCITSAETVLLQNQSGAEFTSKLSEPGTVVVVSVAPQSRAALAALYGMTPAETFQRLTGWFHSLGVRLVLDVSTGQDFALLETAAEFVHRYRTSVLHKAPHDANGSGSSAMDVDGTQPAEHIPPAATGPLPMLASSCPGWVCYAEKTHGDVILPYISSARSPQGVMGGIVKRFLCTALGVDPSRCYHCTVMPCYDKKLEAARDELRLPGTDICEVDSCLTTVEVHQLLQEAGVAHLRDVPPVPLDSVLSLTQSGRSPPDGQLYGLPGGSGGYAEFVLRTAARELFGRTLPAGPLPFKTVRNVDMQELVVEADEPGRPPLLRAARAFGFRNIQAVMRRIKTGKCEYDYVEVMACPSGCLNGGGQLRPVAFEGVPALTPQQLIKQVEASYLQDVVSRHPADNVEVQALYERWVGGGVYGPAAREALHTSYCPREKKVTTTISDW